MSSSDMIELTKDLIKFIFKTNTPENIFYSFIILTIIGFVGLTYKYIFNWKILKEKNDWAKLDIFSKLILSFIVGLGSFLFALSINFLIESIFPRSDIPYSLQNIFILILTFILPFTFKFYKAKEDGRFRNVRWFFIYSIILSIFIFLFTLEYKFLTIIIGVINSSTTIVNGNLYMILIPMLLLIILLFSYMRLAQWTYIIFGKKIFLFKVSTKLLKKVNLK